MTFRREQIGRRFASKTRVNVRTSGRTDSALTRLEGMFLEMPAATLSLEQARSLTRLDGITCLALLIAIAQSGFLARNGTGQFLLTAAPAGIDCGER